MPVRMTGLISGMDTDTLIQNMMDAQRMKNKKVEDKSTLLTWKQDRWKELNTKLYKLYTDDLNKMRLQGSYLTKSVTTSDDTYADVKGLTNAPIGTHKLQVGSLASSQYVTSGVVYLKDANGNNLEDANGNYIKASANTKLKDLKEFIEPDTIVGTLFNITVNGEKKTFEVKENSTLRDFVSFANSAGLSASYDDKYGRLYLSAKSSGEENAFGITATSSTATEPKNLVLKAAGYSYLTADEKKSVDEALKKLKDIDNLALPDGEQLEEVLNDPDKLEAILSNPENAELKDVINEIRAFAEKEAQRKIVDAEIRSEVTDDARKAEEELIRSEVMAKEIVLLKEKAREAREAGEDPDLITDGTLTQEQIDAPDLITEETLTQEQIIAIGIKQDEKIKDSEPRILNAVEKAVATAIAAEKAKEDNRYNSEMDDTRITEAGELTIRTALIYQANSKVDEKDETEMLYSLGLDALDKTGEVISGTANSTVVAATDSSITYNNVEYTGSTNTFNLNGLEISLKKVTTGVETVNLNVTNNTQAVYDMVKKFVTSYNDIIKEMNDLYYAPSSRGYDPLSDEEKNQMTDKDIDKWEDKIKDSVLRNDTTLGSLLSSMKTAMMTSVDVDGARYSLSSFGIQTSANYKENGLLHIFGDEDDAEFGTRADKLLKALGEDPDAVMEALSKISQNLYDTMYDKMKPIPNVRSMFTFYNDKTMSKQQTDYAKKIAQLESKLLETEDRYYKQFAAMETALAKLQSQSNALASMLGTSNQK